MTEIIMSKKTVQPCSDCGERDAVARGWCRRCYERRRRAGDFVVEVACNAGDVLRRIGWDVDSNGCWNWRGRIDRGGYAQVREYPGKHFGHQAHRVAYCEWVGEPPEGWELDHNCNNRRCINPAHLEPVTKLENRRRAERRRELMGGYGRICKVSG